MGLLDKYGKPNENTPKNWSSSYVDYNTKAEANKAMVSEVTAVKQEGDRKRKLSETSVPAAEKKAKKKAKKDAEEAAAASANSTLNTTAEDVNGDGDSEVKKKKKKKKKEGD